MTPANRTYWMQRINGTKECRWMAVRPARQAAGMDPERPTYDHGFWVTLRDGSGLLKVIWAESHAETIAEDQIRKAENT